MLDRANMDRSYWTYALNLDFHLKNLVLHSSLNKTPFEAMHGKKPNCRTMRNLDVLLIGSLRNCSVRNLIEVLKKDSSWAMQMNLRLTLWVFQQVKDISKSSKLEMLKSDGFWG